ncbi:response regulator [Dyadobacter arcticus]|uniref:DNA-binding response OmpR family regulator n=1 Tax=Dyadobacter arcticus TaxID=1078754 RepID=A0ABX0UHY6_9BACT|nr:response regulator [Dyadobacter arcticus]NIJ52527.1 DNA-binding response OmpR family regulator [Dyadobacter arcticus]
MGNSKLAVMIDDDTDDHEILSMALQELDPNLSCLFFSDCESAVAHFKNGSATPPGYVFLDLHLPRVDSDQCLLHLQQLKAFDNPSIIIYSGSIPEQWHTRLDQLGVDKYIKKTGSIPELIDSIQSVIKS